MLERFSPLAMSLLTKPLPTLPGSSLDSSFSSQLIKWPIPAQVKFAASQAQAVVLTGIVITVHEKEH